MRSPGSDERFSIRRLGAAPTSWSPYPLDCAHRVVPLILFLVLGTGCTDSLEPLQRTGVGRAAGDALGTVPIYLALAGITPAPALVTGTRESFVIEVCCSE